MPTSSAMTTPSSTNHSPGRTGAPRPTEGPPIAPTIGWAEKNAISPASSVRTGASRRPSSRRTPNAKTRMVRATPKATSAEFSTFMQAFRRSELKHGGAVDAAGLQVGQGAGGLVERVGGGGHLELEALGQGQELLGVATGVGGDAAQVALLEQVLFVVQGRDVGQVDARHRQRA